MTLYHNLSLTYCEQAADKASLLICVCVQECTERQSERDKEATEPE